jgi:hypothetical protein
MQAAGLPKSAFTQRLLGFFLGGVTTRLASLCIQTDRRTVTEGFPAAEGWLASHWVRQTDERGAGNIPPSGPLLVVSNHVGAYDIAVIPSIINRKDIKVIASASPFFMKLPNVSLHMLYAADTPQSRLAAVRGGIQHLQSGGALLLFGTGLVDPDPEIYPGAAEAIGDWSASIDLFLRQAPDTQVVVSILSGIVKRKWARSALTRLVRQEWQKRRLAEYGQVIEQLLFPGPPDISPSMSIAAPVSLATLRKESGSDKVHAAVVARGRALLAEHMERIGG